MSPQPRTEALIFDMDGTMIDSMPWHARAWTEFARRHGIEMDVADMLRRTTGRTGAECINELFQRDIEAAEAWALMAEKELIYRELFTPVFAVSRISGWTAHVLEQYANNRLIRPRAEYIGRPYPQTYVPLDRR